MATAGRSRKTKSPSAGRLGALREVQEVSGNLELRLNAYLSELNARGDLGAFGGSLDAAEDLIRSVAGSSPDVTLRRTLLGGDERFPLLIAYVGGIANARAISGNAIEMLQQLALDRAAISDPASAIQWIEDAVVSVGRTRREGDWNRLFLGLLSGMMLVFVQGCASVLMLDTSQVPARSVGTASSEPSVKGPQEAFNEVLLTHLGQIRHRVHSPDLEFHSFTLGSYTRTDVAVAHVRGLTNPRLVETVKARLQAIDRDSVQYTSEVGPYLCDLESSLFPLYRISERVDWAVRELMNGKVLVMVDGDPFVISLPVVLMDFFKTTQDYIFSGWEATLVRIVRALGVLLGVYLMPLYIALFSVDPDLVPTKLVLTVAGARQNIPFPPIMEVLIMWVIIEVLSQAAGRLPQNLATTLGTVGAVVVGTAIVKAGIVDPIMIVLVTLSAIGLYTNPTFEMTAPLHWIFWIMVVGAEVLGVLGIILVTVGLVAYLSSLENLGVPYLAPFAPLLRTDLGDTIVRAPIADLTRRPQVNHPVDVVKSAPPRGVRRIRLRRPGPQPGI